jgi:hypothetical protein
MREHLRDNRFQQRFSDEPVASGPKTRAMTSRRFAVVEVEHSTEPPAPVYWRIMRSYSRVPVDQFVAEALMISFPVLMVRVFGHRATQRRLPNEDHPIQAFVLDRANKSLRICIQVW